jgi:pSer/pThr/pTyr-binding forkhead associated (FHA) protein
MASLLLLGEEGDATDRWELGDQPISVGRGDSVDIVIDDALLSRRHFLIHRAGAAFLINDLRSSNGTFVDGKPAKETCLHHHDCILAGRSLFVFSDQPAAARG